MEIRILRPGKREVLSLEKSVKRKRLDLQFLMKLSQMIERLRNYMVILNTSQPRESMLGSPNIKILQILLLERLMSNNLISLPTRMTITERRDREIVKSKRESMVLQMPAGMLHLDFKNHQMSVVSMLIK